MYDLKIYGKPAAELDALVNTVIIFSIWMKFGQQKCATLVVRRGKNIENEGINMLDEQLLQDLGEESHKYLGILETDEREDQDGILQTNKKSFTLETEWRK